MNSSSRFHRMNRNTGIVSVIYHGTEAEINHIEREYNGRPNIDVIRDMSADEFCTLINDMIHYDDPDYVWESNLQPPLPFEPWKEWLSRKADFRERERQ